MGVEDLLKDDNELMKLIEGLLIENPFCDEIMIIYDPSKIDTNALEEYFYNIDQALPGVILRLLPIQPIQPSKEERIFLIPINSKNKPIKIKYK